jgi:uncharacterized protein
MEIKRIAWTSLVDNTSELLTIYHREGLEIRGTVVGAADEQPVGLSYRLKADDNWYLSEVTVIFEGLAPFEAYFVKKGEWWFDKDNNHLKEFDGADDIDITLTPFTNTLPIRRIRLQPMESQEITVIYFDMSELKVYPARQRYTNLGNNNYRFEHLDTGFMAIIGVDDDGFVVDYPGLFKMVYPIQTVEQI